MPPTDTHVHTLKEIHKTCYILSSSPPTALTHNALLREGFALDEVVGQREVEGGGDGGESGLGVEVLLADSRR
ncbi:hypothetical protein E2C01_092307 [Portunus trituberculatus]|uniref:Uncharacterized protein n=1 Tax=Portunus trituberculatus TaxID=210409 RepID=A0A5B7JQ83_PORTR|nr:hypothetical protein [Portunus trituberculatus]